MTFPANRGGCRNWRPPDNNKKMPRYPRERREREMPNPIIGFVGLGRMGGPMAGRLLDAGYALSVYDTQSETMAPLGARGAHLAKSPADVASSSDIVLASLPTP